MRVAFRVDASPMIGMGHLMRCLSLADALRQRGAEVHLIARAPSAPIKALIDAAGICVHVLPAGTVGFAERRSGAAVHADWLGVPWEQDAEQTLDALRGLGRSDWLVTDHYALDDRWQRRMRTLAARLLVIDDLADRDHDCDLLLDQNLWPQPDRRYRHRVGPATRLMLGPAYALLRAEFAALHAQANIRPARVECVLVSFGGVDADNLTSTFLRAVQMSDFDTVRFDIALTSASLHLDEVARLAQQARNVRLHVDTPSIGLRMLEADLGVGAAGVTSLERICLGLPAATVTTADSQVESVEALAAEGLVFYLGPAHALDPQRWERCLRTILDAPGQRQAHSAACLERIDGKGCARVAAVMAESAHVLTSE